jgi:hypothetical protein
MTDHALDPFRRTATDKTRTRHTSMNIIAPIDLNDLVGSFLPGVRTGAVVGHPRRLSAL